MGRAGLRVQPGRQVCQRLPRETARLYRTRGHELLRSRRGHEHPETPPDRQSDQVHRRRTRDDAGRRDLSGPGELLTRGQWIPGGHGLRERDIQPCLLQQADDGRDRLSIGSEPDVQSAADARHHAGGVKVRTVVVDPARRVDDQPRRRRRADRLHRRPGRTSAPRARPTAPTTPRSGP